MPAVKGTISRSARVYFTLLFVAVASVALQAEEDIHEWKSTQQLSLGVRYTHQERTDPRKMVVNCLQVDLRTPDLKFRTTPRRDEWVEGKAETNRQTVRNFIRRSQPTGRKLVVAVNADGFSPWPAPVEQEDPTDISGLAISDGVLVSRPVGSPSVIVRKSGKVSIDTLTADDDLMEIEAAVSGFGLCLTNGEVLKSGDDLHPRTGIGLSQDEQFLYLLTIDGRQPASIGATTEEVGRLLKHYGAHTGINMDGGGSTTMAWWDRSDPQDDKCKLLNSPVGSGKKYAPSKTAEPFRPSERANGNNFGIYYDKK